VRRKLAAKLPIVKRKIKEKKNRWNIAYQLEIDTTGLDTTDFNVEKDTGTL
jgi:hypothetical protein